MWSCHELRNTCLCCTYEEGWIQLGFKVSDAFSSAFAKKKKKTSHNFGISGKTIGEASLHMSGLSLGFVTIAEVFNPRSSASMAQNIKAALVLFLLNYYILTVHLTKQSLRRAIWNTIMPQWYISSVGFSRAMVYASMVQT